MTQAILTATNILSQSIEGLLDLIKDFRENLQAKRMIRKTKKELNALDDFALKDLGISRGDITSIANGTFYDTKHSRIQPTIEQENENLKGWV